MNMNANFFYSFFRWFLLIDLIISPDCYKNITIKSQIFLIQFDNHIYKQTVKHVFCVCQHFQEL